MARRSWIVEENFVEASIWSWRGDQERGCQSFAPDSGQWWLRWGRKGSSFQRENWVGFWSRSWALTSFVNNCWKQPLVERRPMMQWRSKSWGCSRIFTRRIHYFNVVDLRIITRNLHYFSVSWRRVLALLSPRAGHRCLCLQAVPGQVDRDLWGLPPQPVVVEAIVLLFVDPFSSSSKGRQMWLKLMKKMNGLVVKKEMVMKVAVKLIKPTPWKRCFRQKLKTWPTSWIRLRKKGLMQSCWRIWSQEWSRLQRAWSPWERLVGSWLKWERTEGAFIYFLKSSERSCPW